MGVMDLPDKYIPPYVITNKIIDLVADISEMVGSIRAWESMNANPQLRRDNRVKTIHASLAIENNSLSLEQVTAIIDGKRVLGAPGDIQEVKNAFEAYERLLTFDPYSVSDLLKAHEILVMGLVKEAGMFRRGGVGVFAGDRLVHMAPPASFVPQQIEDLLRWVETEAVHPLVKSCVFHYEFEFIHPFADGNGRMGRMWQTLLLSRWKPIFAWLPVETLIRERQDEYYAVLGKSDSSTSATPFIEFLLGTLRDALHDVAKTDQVNVQVSAQVRALLAALGDETLSSNELMARVGLAHRGTFRKNYLQPAIDLGLVEMTVPDKPNSKNQKYQRK